MFKYVSTAIKQGYDSGSEGYQFSIQLEVIGGLFSLTKLSCFVLIFHCFVFTSVTVDFLILSSAFSLINSYIYSDFYMKVWLQEMCDLDLSLPLSLRP